MLVVSPLSLTIVAALSAVALPLTQAAPTSAPLALVRRGARDDIACSFGLSGKQYFQKNGVFVGIYPSKRIALHPRAPFHCMWTGLLTRNRNTNNGR